jgi:lipopolysaccharide export system protein LptC
MKNRAYLINLVILFIAALSVILFWSDRNFKVKKKLPLHSKSPDAFMTNVKVSQFSIDGKLNFILNSPKLTHFNANNSTDITNPHFVILKKNNDTWNITAKNGQALDGLERILLWDSVKIIGAPQGSPSNIELFTDKATYYPAKYFAETDQDVNIIQNDSNVRATGMEVYFNTNVARLLSNVRGQYDPNQ